MPTYSKIPVKVKAIGAIAIGHYAVFCKGMILATNIVAKIRIADLKPEGIPAVGFLSFEGTKYYYCRYGFLDDPDIYAKPQKKCQSTTKTIRGTGKRK